jgi:hypothetical protein
MIIDKPREESLMDEEPLEQAGYAPEVIKDITRSREVDERMVRLLHDEITHLERYIERRVTIHDEESYQAQCRYSVPAYFGGLPDVGKRFTAEHGGRTATLQSNRFLPASSNACSVRLRGARFQHHFPPMRRKSHFRPGNQAVARCIARYIDREQ